MISYITNYVYNPNMYIAMRGYVSVVQGGVVCVFIDKTFMFIIAICIYIVLRPTFLF